MQQAGHRTKLPGTLVCYSNSGQERKRVLRHCDTTETETDAGSSKKTATKREVGMVIDTNTRAGERLTMCGEGLL